MILWLISQFIFFYSLMAQDATEYYFFAFDNESNLNNDFINSEYLSFSFAYL